MPQKGLFNLQTAGDLRDKLRHDLDCLKRSPTNAYEAFNFFVTAEHLLDWQFPGYDNKTERKRVRSEEVILEITSHLANGAKHFQTEAKHHRSVSGTKKSGGYFAASYFPPSYFARSFFGGGGLFVELDGTAAEKFGGSIDAVRLAEKVMAYWDAQDL